MKKILSTIAFILICYFGWGQYGIPQNLGGPNTLVQNPNYGGIKGGLIPFTFTDTTQANSLATALKTYNGAIIYCTTPQALFWRDATNLKWVQVLPSGSPTGLGAWTTTLNTTIPTDISLNGYFGTTANNGIGMYTNNTQRVILPASGLSLKSVVGDTTLNKPMVWNTSTKEWNYSYWFGGGSSSTPISSLIAATGSNSINNANFVQTWQWNSLSGSALKLSTSSTAAAADAQTLLELDLTGANGTSGQITTGINVSNVHTGTNSDNIAGTFASSNGTGNYGIQANTSGGSTGVAGQFVANNSTASNIGIDVTSNGGATNLGGSFSVVGSGANTGLSVNVSGGSTNVGIAVSGGSVDLGQTGFESGILKFLGSTSGTVTIQPAAAAGTWTMTLPTTDGNSGEFLQTDGNGITSWAAVTAGANTALSNLASVAINTSLLPGTDDGAALGSTSKEFSDLFLASGGVINWANGNTTLTQTSGALTLGGAFYATSSVGAGTYLYGGDKYNTYTGYTGAVLGGITTHAVLDFVDNNSRIGEFYTDANNFNFFTDASKGIVFYVNNSFTAPAMQFSSAGALRLGYLGAGALTADASGNITSVSDERLKNIEGRYGVGLSQVYKINPIVYKWKPETKLDLLNSYIGFSAQNIEYALGENAVGINRDGYKSIQDRAILAALTNSIKELKDLNDSQQKEIDDLKKEVKKLKRL